MSPGVLYFIWQPEQGGRGDPVEQAPSTCRRGHCAGLAGQHCDWPSVQGTQPGKRPGGENSLVEARAQAGGVGEQEAQGLVFPLGHPSVTPQQEDWQQAGLGVVPLVGEPGQGALKRLPQEERGEPHSGPHPGSPLNPGCSGAPWAPQPGPLFPSPRQALLVVTLLSVSPSGLEGLEGGTMHTVSWTPPLPQGHTCPPAPMFRDVGGEDLWSAQQRIRSCLQGSQITLPAPAIPAVGPR